MGKLTTHVLDTHSGKPAAGIRIDLFSMEGQRNLLKSIVTNSDGRCDEALLDGENMSTGTWELVFHVGDYFRGQGVATAERAFLDEVPIRFGIDDTSAHYHVPLLATPWSYTTYRGS